MATIYLGLTALVTEFGLGSAVVTLRELSADDVSQLHSVSLLVGLAAFVVSCLAAIPLSRFFDAPELALVVAVLSMSLVLDSLRTVPTALLARALRFKFVALLDALRAIVAVVLTVVLAAFGARHWALVLGNVLAALVMTLVLLTMRPQRFAWPRLSKLKSALTFSSQLLMAQVAWYGYSNADFLVAGRVLGKIALGEYTLAWTMTSTPGEKMMAIFGRVIPTMLAAVQRDARALRRYFFLFTEGFAILIFPAAVGLALVARDFVLLAFGTKWSAAILPLQLLCWHAPIHMLAALLAPVLQVKRDTLYPMRWALLALVVLPPAFYVAGTRWGTVGIAAVWVSIYPLILIPSYLRAFSLLGISVRDYLASLRPTLASVAVMAAVVLATRALVPANWPLALRFGMQVALGGAAYLVAARVFHRLGVLAEFLRAARAGDDAAAHAPGLSGYPPTSGL
jgi:O-antigen/teichoic acid export membrane protein